MGSLRGEGVTMAQFIDTLISAIIVSGVILIGVLANAIYEHYERSKK